MKEKEPNCQTCDPTQFEQLYTDGWSNWMKFPNPQKCEYLFAPFGPGVYQLRCITTKQMILFGQGKNVAWRMSSLLPLPLGSGGRMNVEKKAFVLKNIDKIEYRTMALPSKECAEDFERFIKDMEDYIFDEKSRTTKKDCHC